MEINADINGFMLLLNKIRSVSVIDEENLRAFMPMLPE
jgi:hypothetical protein